MSFFVVRRSSQPRDTSAHRKTLSVSHARRDLRVEPEWLCGGFAVKKATFFGCAFTSKSKYFAFELTDSSGHAIAYCPKTNKFCGMLDRSVKEADTKILLPKVKLPAKAGTCKHVQIELIRY